MKIKKPVLQKVSTQERLSDTTEFIFHLPAQSQYLPEQETRVIHASNHQEPEIAIQESPVALAHPFVEIQTSHCINRSPDTPTLALQVPAYIDLCDEEAILLETVSMRTIKKLGIKKKIKTFFTSIIIMVFSMLFLGVLALLIVLLPIPIYKIEVLIVFFVAFSYFASMLVRYISRMRRKASLSTTQVVRTVSKKPSPTRNRELEHFALAKQDTTAYLQAFTKKVLKRGPRP